MKIHNQLKGSINKCEKCNWLIYIKVTWYFSCYRIQRVAISCWNTVFTHNHKHGSPSHHYALVIQWQNKWYPAWRWNGFIKKGHWIHMRHGPINVSFRHNSYTKINTVWWSMRTCHLHRGFGTLGGTGIVVWI